MALSRDAITQGLYIRPFAEQQRLAIGLEPPPMMWIFEWDILTGDSAVLDVIYAIVRRPASTRRSPAARPPSTTAERMRDPGRGDRCPHLA